MIQCDETTPEASILFNARYSCVCGYSLNRAGNDCPKYKILDYLRPSNLVETNSKQHLDKVYNSDLPMRHKKFIPNKNIGIHEKELIENIFVKSLKITMRRYHISCNMVDEYIR